MSAAAKKKVENFGACAKMRDFMTGEIKCMYPRRVDHTMVEILPIVKCLHAISLVQTDEELDAALSEISSEKILGFDTETRPNFSRKNHYKVAILQLSGENKAWVIRLEPLAHRIADIYKVLENPDAIKAGLAVEGDIRSLSARGKFKPAGFVDVSSMTSKIGIINTGMKNLAALFFGERVSKAAQMSNWEAEELTQKQIDYAATDAWMSRRLYLEVKRVVEENRIDIEPLPETAPEPFDLRRFGRKLFFATKRLLNAARRKIKKAILPKPKKRRRRRGGARRNSAVRRQNNSAN